MKMHKILPFFLSCLLSFESFSQVQKLRMPNGQSVFWSGVNLAWNNFGNDVGDAAINATYFGQVLDNIKADGGNCMRWWLFTNASTAPKFNNGLVSGLGANSINNVKTVLDLAKARNMTVLLSLFSFDLLQTGQSGVNGYNNTQMLTTTNGIQACIDKCIVPLVTAIGNHPGIMAWEIFNEPEGMTTQFGWSSVKIDMYNVQQFVNRAAGAIHTAVPGVLVTNGSWSLQALGAGGGTNYYTDAALKNAGGVANGTLDFYEIHYYGGTYNPFGNPASKWGLGKPILIGEFPSKGINGSSQANFTYAHDNGYVGVVSWNYTNSDGNGALSDAQPALSYLKTNYASDLAYSAAPIYNFGTNIALNRPVAVSSTEAGSGNLASQATDGNYNTRWSSVYADNQSMTIDLGKSYSIKDVVLYWEAAYASAYTVEVSNDTTNWTSLYTTTTGTGGTSILQNLSGTGRYLRIALTTRATQWGFSLYEVEVYGNLVVTGLDTQQETISLASAYPNPFQDKIHLSLPLNTQVQLMDMKGAIFYEGAGNEIETSTFPRGLYLLRVNYSDGGSRNFKVEKR